MGQHWYDRYTSRGKGSHHSFWSDEFEVDYTSDTFKESLSESQIDSLQKYKLSAARKAISNFVTIATGKTIPVKFSTSNESYTDGTNVVLSGDIDESEKFDIGVGLALHEGSHVLLSDFKFLSELSNHIPTDLRERGTKKGDSDVRDTIKNILNVVEDRRIDNFIYQNAPGYREYYLQLYSHYFGDKLITEALESDKWNEETIENYMNRLINLMNPSTSLTRLKGLREIWNVLDIQNIGRLKTTKDAFDVALRIYGIILDNVTTPIGQKDDESSKSKEGEEGENGESGKSNDSDSSDNSDESNDSQPNGKSQLSGDESEDSRGGSGVESDGDTDSGKESDSDNNSTPKSSSQMSSAKQKKLQKVLDKQRDFLNGQTKKKKVTKAMAEEIDKVESSGAELKKAGEGFVDGRGNISKGVEVVVYKKLTKEMLLNKVISLGHVSHYKDGGLHRCLGETNYSEAVSMGVRLGKKLQVRNEARMTVFTHQRNGKVDKRMVHSLGFDSESVFSQIHVDKYKSAHIHLSIDASSSMGGGKWTKTMVNTIAICKAVSMISNLSMEVSFRYSDGQLPIVVIAWDSRKESFKKVETIFPYLFANGTTPEGLCFEALSKLMTPSNSDLDSYFVNISDGEPAFEGKGLSYVGYTAAKHTRKEVEKIRTMGIGVLSYFVSEGYVSQNCKRQFTEMYGKDGKFININSVGEVSQTLNQMFLTK